MLLQFVPKGRRLRTSGDARTLAQLYKHFAGATQVEGCVFMRTLAGTLGPAPRDGFHIIQWDGVGRLCSVVFYSSTL